MKPIIGQSYTIANIRTEQQWSFTIISLHKSYMDVYCWQIPPSSPKTTLGKHEWQSWGDFTMSDAWLIKPLAINSAANVLYGNK